MSSKIILRVRTSSWAASNLASTSVVLYAIDADGGRIFGWSVGAEGALEPVGSWEGVPETVAGLAAS